jgi:peptidoglycan hydrolase CwlO-like protein
MRLSKDGASRSIRHGVWRLARIGAALAAALVVSAALLAPVSSGDLQSQISADQSAAQTLRAQIAAQTAAIQRTAGGLAAAQRRLGALQAALAQREAQLRTVQRQLLAARLRLVALENRLRRASAALAANLLDAYETGRPNLVTVILQSQGFSQLLEQMSFLSRIGNQDARIVRFTRIARQQVFQEVARLGALEERDRALTEQISTQRNQVAALQGALLSREISLQRARSGSRSKLVALDGQLGHLEARAAALAAQTPVQVNRSVGGIAIDTGGMVQPPPGAPLAVRQMIAAGNAIATLPYIWGGGHASFQASGYDCSGSVSYVLAAAGLLSAPEVSGWFETYGDPGPGRWVTIYANASHVWMEIAGWRFDTVALAQDGTRWAQGGGEFAGFVVRHPPGL